MSLDDLPKFIEGNDGGMWLWTGEPANRPTLYVRFDDVVKLLEETQCQNAQDYQIVL